MDYAGVIGSDVSLARMSGLQCFNMGHNGNGINLYGVSMTLMGNKHAGGQSSLGHLSLVHRDWSMTILIKNCSTFIGLHIKSNMYMLKMFKNLL